MATSIDFLVDFFNSYGKSLLFALIILVLGLWLINRISRILMLFLHKSNADLGIISILDSLIKVSLRILLAILILASLKVNIISMITAISASLLTIGLALKDSLSNFAAGVLIVLNKPVHIGDHIEIDSVSGVVVRIDTMFTMLCTDDDKTIIVPNSKMISSVIVRKSDWDVYCFNFRYLIKNIQNFKGIEKNFERHILAPESNILANPASEFKFTVKNNNESEINLTVWIRKNKTPGAKQKLKALMYSQFEKCGAEIVEEDISHSNHIIN
ncbi:MAG: mechanosensitive ion channel family protein [Oscillospiraceae bacterium]|nr:mechanosensitive ion channel family protein [Oscillospiraceae bacterium]